jgi:periplasmic protein CpxP/Spy
MASVSRNKIYVLLIGILLLSNLALVAFFVTNKPEKKEVKRERPGGYMKEALKNEVGFDEQQMARFEDMASNHKQQMRPLFEDISKTKESFYKLLTQPGTPDSILNISAREIGEKQRLLDLKIFTHFQNIRELCTPEQRPKFDTLVQRVVHRMIFPMRRSDGKKQNSPTKN